VIAEHLESKIEALRGLHQVKVRDLRKLALGNKGKGIQKLNYLPTEGAIEDYVKHQDHLICDVDTSDLWLKIKINFDSPVKNMDAEMHLKLRKSETGLGLSRIIQKLCIRVWNQVCQDDEKVKMTYFILKRLFIQKIDLQMSEQELQAQKRTGLKLIVDSLKVHDMFTYQNNAIQVFCYFNTLENEFVNQRLD